MNDTANNVGVIYWLPRIGGAAIAVFFAFFATRGPFEYMQLIPSLFVVFIVIISWSYDLNGFFGFLIFGIITTFLFSTYKAMLNFLLISLPIFMVSAFYLVSFFDKKDKTSTT